MTNERTRQGSYTDMNIEVSMLIIKIQGPCLIVTFEKEKNEDIYKNQ